MRDIQKLNRLLDALAERYGIANLVLPSHGALGLRLKDGSALYLEHDGAHGTLYAYMPVVPLPQDDALRLKLFARMLEWNFLGAGVECGVLSIQREMATCHVNFTVADLQFETFDSVLQNLIAVRADLVERLKVDMQGDSGRTMKMNYASSARLASLRQEA